MSDITSYVPKGMQEIKEFCAMVSKSNIVPKEYIGKPENVFVACLKGMDLGLKPLQALECIAVINGKTSLYGDAYLAIARGSGKLENYHEEIVGSGMNMKAVTSVKRKGEDKITSEYSAEDAKVAGLWGKAGPWTQHPKRMLTMKARNFGLRAAFADLFLGMEYSAEELMEVAESRNNSPRDVTPAGTSAPDINDLEVSSLVHSDMNRGPFYNINDEMITGHDLSSLIQDRIDGIASKVDLELYEIWKQAHLDSIKDFCKFNKEICLDFKESLDKKKAEFEESE